MIVGNVLARSMLTSLRSTKSLHGVCLTHDRMFDSWVLKVVEEEMLASVQLLTRFTSFRFDPLQAIAG